MSSNTPDPKKNSVLEIAATIGGMAGLFTVIELMIKDDLLRVVGILLLSAAALGYLIQRRLVNAITAVLIVFSTFTSIGLVFSFISQPGILIGYVYDTAGAPAAGLNLVLTNSNGIQQLSVTDKVGRFEVRNVPEGTYNIKVNNQLIFTGNMPNGLQRLLTQSITVGGIIYAGTQPPAATSVAASTLNPPTQPSPIPITSVMTPNPTNTPTLTSTPLPPTETLVRSTMTPIPLVRYLGTMFQEDFENGSLEGLYTLTGNWHARAETDGNMVYCADNQDSRSYAVFNFGEYSWRDYSVEMRVKLLNFDTKLGESGFVSLSVRFGPDWSMYVYFFNAYRNDSDLGLQLTPNNYNKLHYARVDIQRDTWYLMRTEVQGTHLRGFLNEQILHQGNDSSLATGRAAVEIGPNTSVCVDDIIVRSLDDSSGSSAGVQPKHIVDDRILTVGPGTTYPPASAVKAGEEVFILGWNKDKKWIHIRKDPEGIQGWIPDSSIQ